MSAVLAVDDLTVTFQGFCLGPLDLSVGPGICAVLGPNGSGKSTLIGALMGLVRVSSGSVGWAGHDLPSRSSEVLRDVGYVSDSADDVFPQLSAAEYWSFLASIRARTYREDARELSERAILLADRLSLAQVDDRIEGYSLGMRRKTQLIGALMTRPRLLVVDEPQNGLDFSSSNELRSILVEAADSGCTVLMSNHDLDSVARVAHRVLVLQDGAVVGDLQVDGGRRRGHELEDYVRDRLGV